MGRVNPQLNRSIKHIVTTHEFFEINEADVEPLVFETLWASLNDTAIGQTACQDKPFDTLHQTESYREIDGVIINAD
jgi:hypothetical protein